MRLRRKDKVIVGFENSSVESPIVRFNLTNGDVIYAVVDTGSESSLYDSNFVKAHRDLFSLEYTNESVLVVNTTRHRDVLNIINATADAVIKDKKLEFTGIINKMQLHTDIDGKRCSVSLIIGNDILTKYNAHINYSKKTVSFTL